MNLKSSTSATRTTTILYLSLSVFYLPIIIQAYEPVDSFSISCGSSGNSSDGERTWTGDINSKLLSLPESQNVAAQVNKLASSANKVPYATARLSRSEFRYSFPVTAGQKFVRLFFYPASYPGGFDRSDAFFAVKSGEFTLLRDFNSSLNADYAQTDTIFKEYIINVDNEQRINLTFTPNSYAFVNGIEVVSMPTDLYYTSPNANIDQEIIFVSIRGNPFSIENSSALETGYRIKAGGQTITPKNDTGMLRLWEKDDDYLRSPFAVRSVPGDIAGNMSITVNPEYVAPKEVYRKSRDMGRNGDLNKVSNLTWEFPVDTGFNYMLRLHFCELDSNINVIGDRVFSIYIASQTAADRADVLTWSKQRGVAVHRDYVVIIPQGSQKKVNLSLQMHPNPDSKIVYPDPFLNGLEIFKISDAGSKNLAGPNPDARSVPNTPSNQPKSKSSTSTATIIGVVLGVACGVALLSALALFLLSRRSKTSTTVGATMFSVAAFSVVHFFHLRRSKTETENTKGSSRKSPFSLTTSAKSRTTQLPSDLCRRFSLAEMRAATSNLDELLLVGVGGFGKVYKGYIEDGATPVAIKRLKPGSQQGAHEFRTEIEMLSQLRHLHLVSLIGYCCESNEMILVHDFVATGITGRRTKEFLFFENNGVAIKFIEIWKNIRKTHLF